MGVIKLSGYPIDVRFFCCERDVEECFVDCCHHGKVCRFLKVRRVRE